MSIKPANKNNDNRKKNASGELFHLIPVKENQFVLEINLDRYDDSFNISILRELNNYTQLPFSYDSEFSLEFYQPFKNRLGELIEKTLTSLSKDKKSLYINSIKVLFKGTLILIIPAFIIVNAGLANAAEDKLSMSYIYFGTETQQMAFLDQTQKSLNTVSPSYFTLTDDGQLILNNISTDFIAYAHNQGLKVIPYLSNGWDYDQGVAALNNMDKLTDDLAQAIVDYNLDGVNIDLEALTENQSADYVSLVRLLKEKLPQGIEVSVAVAANPRNYQTGWHASYNYSGLAEYADYLIVMAYDEHYGGSSSGPVASLDFTEDAIAYALDQTSADKIVLGIPFYGRIWSTGNDSVMGRGITLYNIDTMIKNYRGVTAYSENYHSPYARITVEKTDPAISIGGTVLNPGNYIIWYENSDSLKSKLSLVQKYDLKGTSSWSLGQETADVWEYYSLWLNGKYFSDIENSFAKDDIIKAALSGLMVGVSENQFGPQEGLTRAQAAVIFCRALDLSLDTDDAPFSDTSGHWAQAEISAAYQAGLVQGYGDGTYQPNAYLTREEVAVLLARIIDLSSLEENTDHVTFADIQEGRWSYPEITALADANILRGYENHIFAPAKILNREEMAALLERIGDYLPQSEESDT